MVMWKYKTRGDEREGETYAGVIKETGIRPAQQKIEYATMMLYYNIKQKMIAEKSDHRKDNTVMITDKSNK